LPNVCDLCHHSNTTASRNPAPNVTPCHKDAAYAVGICSEAIDKRLGEEHDNNKGGSGESMLARIYEVLALAILVTLGPAAWAGPSLLFDVTNGAVLYAEDVDTPWHPASLTKMMTAYVTFVAVQDGTLALDTPIGCSKLANAQGPTRLGLPVGATITVETALQALIMKSANDVAVMLAEAVSGSHEAFVDYMNGMAGRLGMTRTKFANANGLPDPDQITTARDMGKLATAIVRDFPQYAYMWALREMRVGKRQLRTHNGLLIHYPGADGMKTGFICDSGFNIVASATRADHKLIAVVFGEATVQERGLRTANLLEHGFRTYAWKALFGTQTLETMGIDEGAQRTVTKPAKVFSPVCGTGAGPVAQRKKGRALMAEGGAKVHQVKPRVHGTSMAKKNSPSPPW
jgi:D-alanyl-D-alanine carboxypeptidase